MPLKILRLSKSMAGLPLLLLAPPPCSPWASAPTEAAACVKYAVMCGVPVCGMQEEGGIRGQLVVDPWRVCVCALPPFLPPSYPGHVAGGP